MSGTSTRLGTVDPAPAAADEAEALLAARLLDPSRPMFDRMRALFRLRELATPGAIEAMARSLRVDGSALLRHEIAYVFGQMQDTRSIPHLADALFSDPNPMVRHESAESLGNMPVEARGTTRPLLEKALATDRSIEVRESCEVALANLDFLDSDEMEY